MTSNNSIISDNWYYIPTTTSTPSYTYTWHTCTCSNPKVIQKYQLICPSCETTNWGQIDEIITCKNAHCGATLKAVQNPVNYEIVVDD
jgi:hypothetical protein